MIYLASLYVQEPLMLNEPVDIGWCGQTGSLECESACEACLLGGIIARPQLAVDRGYRPRSRKWADRGSRAWLLFRIDVRAHNVGSCLDSIWPWTFGLEARWFSRMGSAAAFSRCN